jgi:hypothetical protein
LTYLNQWTQPDPIVSDPSNPQSLNRYAYVLDSPIMYNDPSGYTSCQGANWDDGPQCTKLSSFWNKAISTRFTNVNIKNQNDWKPGGLQTLYSALDKILGAFSGNMNAFTSAFKSVTFTPVGSGTLGNNIAANTDMGSGIVSVTPEANEGTLIHEMGHVFDAGLSRGYKGAGLLSQVFVTKYNLGTCTTSPCYPNDVIHIGPLITIYQANTTWRPAGKTTLYAGASSLEDFADSFASTVMNNNWVSEDRQNTINALIQMYSEPYSH